MFVEFSVHQTVFCSVSPDHINYGKIFPVWTLYNDGSFSRMRDGTYFRSPINKLAKHHSEYTLIELTQILDEKNDWAKDAANSIKKEVLEEFRKKIEPLVLLQPCNVIRALAEYYADIDPEWKELDMQVRAANEIIEA